MPVTRLTLLIERLPVLIDCADPEVRYAALEWVLARGAATTVQTANPDALRCRLFGLDTGAELPVGALTWLADRGHEAEAVHHEYVLRVEPVTLKADLTRVIMTGHGMDHLAERAQREIADSVKAVLRQEGLVLQADPSQHWTVTLADHPGFEFPTLHQALGADIADVMPGQPEARNWRRLANEIQMALHATEANNRLREHGLPEINSVWFWGGGRLPAPVDSSHYRTVFANQPVSRGLAILQGNEVHPLDALKTLGSTAEDQKILVDWLPEKTTPAEELGRLEQLIDSLLPQVRAGKTELNLVGGDGRGWTVNRLSGWQFWKRLLPLAEFRQQMKDPQLDD